MADSRRIVIVGGGVIGLGIACHLARLGMNDVLLLERNQLSSGTSWHAAGIVGPLRASFNLTRLASYACELFPALEAQTGQSTGFRQTGGYWLAREPARMQELKRIAAIGEISAGRRRPWRGRLRRDGMGRTADLRGRPDRLHGSDHDGPYGDGDQGRAAGRGAGPRGLRILRHADL